MRHAACSLSILLCILLGWPTLASAQYFGQNKVQYEQFDFQVMRTDHFDIYFYPEERTAVEAGARMAERWRARLSAVLEHELSGRQPLILYGSHPEFVQTTAIFGQLGEGTGGVTEPLQRRVVLPFTGSLADTDHVLGHELVHAFQFDMGGERLQQLPLWFIEGMAEYLSVGPVDTQTGVWLRDAAQQDRLPGFDDLTNPRYFPYRFGHAAWAYIGGRFGDAIIRNIFAAASQTGDPLGAIEQLTGQTIDELSAAWHEAIRRTYAELQGTRGAGEPLVTKERGGGETNVGPVLSPDGTRVAFYSERGVFSIELYIANTATGEIEHRLTSTATDPHLDSIQFIQSAGTWRPDGGAFVAPIVKAGRAGLRLFDVRTGDVIRDVVFEAIGETLHPSWSRDGNTLVFAGVSGGISDLYLYDLAADRLTQLTDDLYTDLEPDWSPDGRALVWVTDRFTTMLPTLAFGPTRLARMDVPSRQITPIAGYDGARHINPQFAPDGGSIYFVADPNGVPNIHRVVLETGRLAAITNVSTGVIGITATSPALSVADRTGAIAFSTYRDGANAIYALPAAPPDVALTRVNGAALPPPRGADDSLVAQTLRDERAGLPSSSTFPTTPYAPSLSVVAAGAGGGPTFGSSYMGTQFSGGVSLLLSDVLGRHLLGITVEAAGGVRDIGAQVQYINQTHRWAWGAAVQRAPWRSGLGRQFLGALDGQPAIVEEIEIFRQTDNRVEGLAQYAFNRATRLELSTGVRYITFDHELETRLFSASTGALIEERRDDIETGSALTLADAGAALVFDTSIFGATGPILGTRSRVEVQPVLGSVQFTELLADYRRYFSPVQPVTIAARGLHVGRYGGDSDSGRLTPLFLGYPSLVRGYDVGSFNANECIATAESTCPAFDQLTGSRLLVANLEVRAPLVGLFTGDYNYGPLPVEAFAFADAGMAWSREGNPFANGSGDVVRSAGVGARVNVFGYLIAEFAAAKPFDRPDRSWQFVFAVQPGF